ncbi:hypothetical protein KHA80_13235 [Anaerobacillus sp. HL2]|nr:hypothetical protein KHA80_13235 [Anaerobacillus sp. HL2]
MLREGVDIKIIMRASGLLKSRDREACSRTETTNVFKGADGVLNIRMLFLFLFENTFVQNRLYQFREGFQRSLSQERVEENPVTIGLSHYHLVI